MLGITISTWTFKIACISPNSHAEMMGDIMYFHQAMQQDDASEFVKAVVKEVNGNIEHKRWQLVQERDSRRRRWSMRRKRNLTSNEVTKYKSRLNLHGGKQVFGMNYNWLGLLFGPWWL